MTGLELERIQAETPRGKKPVKPGSGPLKLQAHDADYEEMFSKFSPTVRRRFIQQMIEIAAAVPGRDLDDLYLIDSQTDEVTCLKQFDEWSDTYDRKIRTGASATFLWEETTSPVCPCCDRALYWHYQSGCDHEGDIGDWDRRETIQPETLFDYAQTAAPVDSTDEDQLSHKPWRVEFLSQSPSKRAEAVLGTLDVFESNAGYSVNFVPPTEWDSLFDPASVDQNSVFMGHPSISALDDDSLPQKAQNAFYGLSVSAHTHAPDSDQTTLSILLLTELLCKHYGIPGITTPHESYFDEASDFSLDLLDDVLDRYCSLITGVNHRL